MPIRWCLDAGVVHVHATGTCTADDFYEFRRDVWVKDRRTDHCHSVLMDFSAVEQLSLSAVEMFRLANQHGWWSRLKAAVVAPEDSAFGMMQIYAGYVEEAEDAEDERMRVCRDHCEASRWLNLH